jgi:hypothetical protein
MKKCREMFRRRRSSTATRRSSTTSEAGPPEGVLAFGLPVPSRNTREAVRDILNLDVERGGVE